MTNPDPQGPRDLFKFFAVVLVILIVGVLAFVEVATGR